MISLSEAEKSAIAFLVAEWELSEEEQEWLSVVNSRVIPNSWWSIVEVGVKDLPDKWVIQVYEDGDCDPCYTFTSPFSKVNSMAQLAELPKGIADALQEERNGHI